MVQVDAENRQPDVLIAGLACRLPGAPSAAEFWSVLYEGRCTVTDVGDGRWPRGRYFHPRPGEPGKACTFRAGVLDAPWSFDPSMFGISPREAAQIDPQQRLLLELVWEALEDAGVAASRLAGTSVGVFVGASSVDHGTRRVFDLAGGDTYYMTGSALSLIANRISHVFDFAGPSFVVDTACSSSLVALNQAMAALRRGEIDTAIVAGVNMLLTPFPFIGFSQARMLSPEGLCRAFSANGQGYVRAEGGVAIVLAREGAAVLDHGAPHARIVASGVNSDGRTVGVSLPSFEAQGRLLRSIYDSAGIDPDRLAFFEAHGTGTRAGDPIEARAIGEQIGRRRRDPLPIGSAKSNVGHLEPASGLVGLLKATLALHHDLLPATLHAEELNPDITFAELNLRVARQPVALPRTDEPRLAGISAFGFGGTNAHVVIADPIPVRGPAWIPGVVDTKAESQPRLAALLTARTDAALTEGAGRIAAVLTRGEASTIGAALAHHRDRLSERAVIIGDLDAGLAAIAGGDASEHVVRGQAVAAEAPVAFVFSGNGSQWAGMGLVALDNDPIFRRHFTAIGDIIERQAGWSVIEMLDSANLADQIRLTRIAQPLLFALQAAAADTLRERGLAPSVVVGHSVGEVAAAYAAGLYDRERAVRLIIARSVAQEFSRDQGRMAVLHASDDEVRNLLDSIAAPSIEIAAINSPTSVTLVGPADEISDMLNVAEAAGLSGQPLDIDYPFHSRIMDAARNRLHADLADLVASPGNAIFISTVDAAPLDADALDADYWWRNVRMPVLFADAIRRVASHGAGVFVEIGPRPVLRTYLDQTLRAANAAFAIVPTFSRQDQHAVDALAVTCATAIARGARFDAVRAFGPPPPTGWRFLPHYAWQRTHLFDAETADAIGGLEVSLAGPAKDGLIGYRASSDVPVWHSHLDTVVCPELGDHRVAGKSWLPAAAFADMALSAAQMWLGHDRVELRDLDIVRPLVLSAEALMDVRTSIDSATATCQIDSRPCRSDDPWQVHARCRVTKLCDADRAPSARMWTEVGARVLPAADVYAQAKRVGLDYGPAFRRLSNVRLMAGGEIHVDLDPAAGLWPRACVLSPTDLDAAFHGLFALLGGDDAIAGDKAYIPVRLGRLQIVSPSATVVSARISDVRVTRHALCCSILLFDADGAVVAGVEEARFAVTALKTGRDADSVACHFVGRRHLDARRASSEAPDLDAFRRKLAALPAAGPGPSEEAVLLLDAAAQRAAYDALQVIAGPEGRIDVGAAAGPLATAIAIARRGGLIVTDETVRLVNDCPVPPLDQIMPALLAEHPAYGAECALLSDAAAVVAKAAPKLRADSLERSRAAVAWTPATATWQHYRQHAPRARAAVAHVRSAVEHLTSRWPHDRPLRLLQLGADGALIQTSRLATLVAEGRLQLTIADDDAPALRAFRARIGNLALAALVELDDAGFAALSELGPFDALVASGILYRFDARRLATIRSALAPRAVLFAVEPDAGPAAQLICSLMGGQGDRALPVRDAARWQSALASAGFTDVDVQVRQQLSGLVVISGSACDAFAEPRDEVGTADGAPRARRSRVVAVDQAAVAGFAALFDVARRTRSDPRADAAGDAAVSEVIILTDAGCIIDDPRRAVADAIALIKETLAYADTVPARVWVVASGGARHLVGEGRASPVATAIWPLVRTIANEHPHIDFRAVDFAEAFDVASQAARLAELVAAPGDESEIVLTVQGYVALRAAPGLAAPRASGKANLTRGTRLALDRPGALQSLRWDVVERRAPTEDEVEIEVAAASLNFRDVMWATGVLPVEALEDGFAGPTVGFECAGTVVRAGARVTHLGVGDRVFAMAPATLASHVTVAAAAVSRVPESIDLTAAVTVPVAFLTAHYALDRLGRLRAGEWVLIHGGAGGVGLAAIQIAKARGVRIIATAGTREKRALLRQLGADHVFSSRSLAFVDEIRAVVPDGVHVVLNALAGEAMERSLELVRPFGRFLELGKRDYYENAKIALRPFRRNVSYFGIDVDQLAIHDPRHVQELMSELCAELECGALHPLPYRCFDAEDTLAAFRLMQQSGHIGKIVVAPLAPRDAIAAPLPRTFSVAADGVHLVVGGLGGFGMATAEWLVERGARALALASRSGAPGPDAAAAIARLRAQGVEVLLEACDVTDGDAVACLLERVRERGMRLASVFHCAMVIEDGVLANMDRDAVERVLAPKIDGARHLDRLTRGAGLDHFVLYASATTLLGNPGQGAYVAANGYLEGLAHERAAAGEPALAVAWGAIADTGYLARDARAASLMSARTGAIPMTAREALHHLEVVLARDDLAPVATIAPVDLHALTQRLPVLKRPTFAALAPAEDAMAQIEGPPDLAAEIAGLDAAAAHAVLLRHLTGVIAAIMRTPASSVEARRPLAEMGIDSLMTVELQIAARERFGMELPLGGLVAGATIDDLAARLLQRLKSGPSANDAERDLIAKHLERSEGTPQAIAAQ